MPPRRSARLQNDPPHEGQGPQQNLSPRRNVRQRGGSSRNANQDIGGGIFALQNMSDPRVDQLIAQVVQFTQNIAQWAQQNNFTTGGVSFGPQNTGGVGSCPQNARGSGSDPQNTGGVGSSPQTAGSSSSGPQNAAGSGSGPQNAGGSCFGSQNAAGSGSGPQNTGGVCSGSQNTGLGIQNTGRSGLEIQNIERRTFGYQNIQGNVGNQTGILITDPQGRIHNIVPYNQTDVDSLWGNDRTSVHH